MRRRPLIAVLLFLALTAIAVLGYLFLLSVLRGKAGPFDAAIPAFVLALGMLVINRSCFRADGMSLAEVGFDRPHLRLAQIAAGLAGGAITAGAWIAAMHMVLPVAWRSGPRFHLPAAAGAFVFIIFNNLAEELAYRSYLFVRVMRSYGAAVAVAVTSLLFTLMHIQAGVPWPNALAGVFTSALIFAALFLRWRSVPLVLGFHAGMNVTQEMLGLRVSGLTVLTPEFGRVTQGQSAALLILAAVINLAVAALFWRRQTSYRA